ncbi:MAG: hypothetical protein UHN02_03945 [Acutalibacteraceae bacterium]|nr:hypothetical protein [Acutalibacteraceae bacterium]
MDMKKINEFASKYLKLYMSKETAGHQSAMSLTEKYENRIG